MNINDDDDIIKRFIFYLAVTASFYISRFNIETALPFALQRRRQYRIIENHQKMCFFPSSMRRGLIAYRSIYQALFFFVFYIVWFTFQLLTYMQSVHVYRFFLFISLVRLVIQCTDAHHGLSFLFFFYLKKKEEKILIPRFQCPRGHSRTRKGRKRIIEMEMRMNYSVNVSIDSFLFFLPC